MIHNVSSFVAQHFLTICLLAFPMGMAIKALVVRFVTTSRLIDRVAMAVNAVVLAVICACPAHTPLTMSVVVACCACGGFLLAGLLAGN